MLAVLVVLGILAAIAAPSVVGLIEKSKEDICVANRVELKKTYERYVAFEDEEDSEIVFNNFLLTIHIDVCPADGVINYVDGEIQCSVHSKENEGAEEGKSEVPFL